MKKTLLFLTQRILIIAITVTLCLYLIEDPIEVIEPQQKPLKPKTGKPEITVSQITKAKPQNSPVIAKSAEELNPKKDTYEKDLIIEDLKKELSQYSLIKNRLEQELEITNLTLNEEIKRSLPKKEIKIAANSIFNKHEASWTSLHRAAALGHTSLVKLLLDEEINLNAKDTKGRTALHYAVLNDRDEIIKILLNSGLAIHDQDSEGLNSLHLSAKANFSTFKLLIDSGADISTKDKNGKYIMHWAAYYGSKEHLNYLVKNNDGLDKSDSQGNFPIHDAVNGKQIEMIKTILSHGGQLNYKNKLGMTALHIACQNNQPLLAALLIKKGADSNAADYLGKTPLHYAASQGYYKLIALLCSFGAVPTAVDYEQQTPLHLTAIRGSVMSMKALIKHGALFGATDIIDRTPLYNAVYYQNDECTQYLFDRGADINIVSGDNLSPLLLAKKLRSKSTLKIFGHDE
jgi:cytohesin